MNILCLILLFVLSSCSLNGTKYPVVRADNDAVRISLKDVGDGRAHFYSFKSGNRSVDFFVRMDGREKLHAYFDACFTCSRSKKGYREEGTDLVCNECKTRFRLADEVWRHKGGCAPIAVPSITTRDAVVIKSSDLKRGARLF